MSNHRGVLYLLSGLYCAELLVTSLWSLRKHYDGAVSVFVAGANCDGENCVERPDLTSHSLARHIAKDKRLDFNVIPFNRKQDYKYPHRMAKCYPYLLTPYVDNLYLDADTIIQKNPEPLFGHPLTFTGYGDSINSDNPACVSIHRRTRNLKPTNNILRKMVNRARSEDMQGINLGVFGFARDHPLLYETHHLMLALSEKVSDEIAVNLSAHRYREQLRFVPPEWNVQSEDTERLDGANIIHFQQQGYKKTRRANEVFMEHYRDAIAHDAGGMAKWSGLLNPFFRKLAKAGNRKLKYKHKQG